MTLGVAAFGPNSGKGVLAALTAVERVAHGAIGGFVSFAALTEDGRLVRAVTQTGGADALFGETPPPEIARAPLAGLISSGPNRPDPLAEFIAAEAGVGIVTGHRMPQMRVADGVPLNVHVLRRMKGGADPQKAVNAVLAAYPEMDAGFLACSADGRIGLGSTPPVLARGDQGSGILEAEEGTARVASIHNAIHPHRLIATLANEVALDRIVQPEAPLRWITMTSGIALQHAAAAKIQIGATGLVEGLFHPQSVYQSGSWSMGLGDQVAVMAEGKQIGWLGYEPFMTLVDGKVQSIDGKHQIDVPLLDRLPF